MKCLIMTICLSVVNSKKSLRMRVGKNSKKLGTRGYHDPHMPEVGLCKGYCSSDSQCKDGLTCYNSHRHGDIVTGCEHRATLTNNYCYDANYMDHLNINTLTVKTPDQKAKTRTLKANTRTLKAKTPTLKVKTPTLKAKTRALKVKTPTRLPSHPISICHPQFCKEWDTFMWCNCFDVNKEPMYVSYGCPDDGAVLVC